LFGMNLAIARKAFIRVRDLKYLELIDKCEEGVKNGDPSEMYLAEALAYQGKFHEAAKMFAKANRVDKAMEMFSDLRQFDEAKNGLRSTRTRRAGTAPSSRSLFTGKRSGRRRFLTTPRRRRCTFRPRNLTKP